MNFTISWPNKSPEPTADGVVSSAIAVRGPVIGIPILMATGPASTNPFLYPVVRSMVFLSDIFTPDRDMTGLIFLYPLLVLYFAIIGVAVAFAARLLWRKFAV